MGGDLSVSRCNVRGVTGVTALQLPDVRRMIRALAPTERAALMGELHSDAVKDKSYELLPLGAEAAAYLRAKRKRLTASSFRDYESCLDKFARYFAHVESLAHLEPPIGTERMEEFLDHQWGKAEPRTYNKNLSVMRDFFKWARLRGRLNGDPTLAIERAKTRQVYRTTFNSDQRRAILAAQESLRDRIALRLLLDYGIRRGSLQTIQFKHFDHVRKQLTLFGKGGKVRQLPIPHAAFWHDLERHILDIEAEPSHYLMPTSKGNQSKRTYDPTTPVGVHGLHDWWYRCLAGAGIVPEGVTAGERMHKARHTAGQRVLDKTGNLKAAQMLLGHSSIQTTGDIYADWDIDQLTATMRDVLDEDDS
jgi:site-specific recombinase XerD